MCIHVYEQTHAGNETFSLYLFSDTERSNIIAIINVYSELFEICHYLIEYWMANLFKSYVTFDFQQCTLHTNS